VDDYITELTCQRDKTPSDFHKYVIKAGRENQEKLIKGCKKSMQGKFEIPTSSFMYNEFRQEATEKLKNEGDQKKGLEGLNELKMRTFLFNVMLGQCLKHARDIASVAYKRVFLQVLDHLGSTQFNANSEQILAALKEFTESKQDVKRKDNDDVNDEMKPFVTLQAMFTQEAFEHMYAGYVTYMLLPVLYATVLGKLYEQNTYQITSKYARDNYVKAMSMIGDRDDWKVQGEKKVLRGAFKAADKFNTQVGKDVA